MPHDDTSYYEDLNPQHTHVAHARRHRSPGERGRGLNENDADRKYQEYLRSILKEGTNSSDRTGVGTRKVVGRQMRFDLSEGFPLIGVRPIWAFGAFREMMWFLRGRTNIWHLLQDDVGIWTDDAYRAYLEKRKGNGKQGPERSKDDFEQAIKESKKPDAESEDYENFAYMWGDLGDIYGKMWRSYTYKERTPALKTMKATSMAEKPMGFDQIEHLIQQLGENPDSRRLKVSAWHPRKHMSGAPEESKSVLPPCHVGFQVVTEKMTRPERVSWRNEDKRKPVGLEEGYAPTHRLNLIWSQRSADSMLGIPFNIAGYGLLAHLLADQAGMAVGELVFQGGDCHIYQNHLGAAHELAARRVSPSTPQIRFGGEESIEDYRAKDIEVENYNPNSKLEADLPMCS